MAFSTVPSGWEVREITPEGVRDEYKVVATVDIDDEGLSPLKDNPQIDLQKLDEPLNRETLQELLLGTDPVHGLIYRTNVNNLLTANPDLLRFCRSLLAMVRAGIGVGKDYPRSAAQNGIGVFRTPDANRESVYRYTMEMINHALSPFQEKAESLRRGKWDRSKWSLSDLEDRYKGKKLFVIGVGGIGSRVAKDAARKGMDVMFIDPKVPEMEGCRMVKMMEGLTQADVVTVHVDGEDQVLGAEELQAMKGVLINTSRGTVVNPEDLVIALGKGTVRSAYLDVFRTEGQELFDDEACVELVNNPLVYPTSHLLGQEVDASVHNAKTASENIARYLTTGVVREGWNVPDMAQLDGLFDPSKKSVTTISLLNMDIPSVHRAISDRIVEVLGHEVNKGADRTDRSHRVNLADDPNGRAIAVASRLVEYDFNGASDKVLSELLRTFSQVNGLLKARLFRYERTS